MNPKRKKAVKAAGRSGRALVAKIAGVALTSTFAMGQQSATPTAASAATGGDDAGIVVLSPFVVQEEPDASYRAKESLSGSRLRTNLEDVTAPIDVITPEVLEDLAATTIDGLFDVISNVEANGNQVFDTVYDSGNIYRVRGFSTNVSLRNFVAGTTPFESYNSTTLVAAKGPNSILFGVGPGGGSLNYTTKRYWFGRKNSQSVSVRMDNWGSLRTTFDADQQLIKDRWGMHVSLLHENQKFEIEPGYWKKRGIYLSTSAKLFKNTELTVNYESRRDETFQPSTNFTNLVDYFSTWEDAGAPGVLTSNTPSNRRVSLLMADGTTVPASAATDLRLWGMERWGGDRYTFFDGGGTTLTNPAYSDRTRQYSTTFFNQRNFLVDQVAPGLRSRDVNSSGYNNGAWVDYEAIDATLQTTLFDDLHLQFVAGRNNSERLQIQAPSRELYRDVNVYMPDGVTHNPHYGDYYIEGVPAYNDRRFTADTFTVTAAYRLDLASKAKSKWTRWLFGQHDLALMHSYVEQSNNIFRDRLLVVGTPSGPLTITNYLDSKYRAYLREYIDVKDGYMSDYRSFARSNEPFELGGYTLQNVRNAGGAPSFQGEDITSDLFVVQSQFLDRRLIVNFGYRDENVKKHEWQYAINPAYGGRYTAYEPMTREQFEDPTYVRTLTNEEPQRTSLPDVVYDTVSGVSRNLGGILHITNNIALAANTAQNINPTASRVGIFGVSLPSSEGESEDFGLRLAFFDNKLRVEYNRYRTSRTNDQATTGALRVPFEDAQNMTAIMKNAGAISLDPFATGLAWDTRDYTARGHEITVSFNPNRTISARLTVTKNSNVSSNVGGTFGGWWEQNKDDLAAFAAGPNGGLTDPNSTATIPQTFAESYADAVALLSTQSALEGQQDPNLSRWSAKFLGKYSFVEGRLKGLEIGTNVAWYSDMISGYWRLADLNYDTDRPFYAKGYTTVNLFTSYSRRFTVAGHAVNWKVQLNVNNVLNQTSPILQNFQNTTADEGADVVGWSLKYRPARTFVLTNTFSF